MQTITLKTREDVLSAVPVVLGFHPQDSVVMMTFGGLRSFHARVDVPASDEQFQDLASALLAPCAQQQVQSVVFVIYTDVAEHGHWLKSMLTTRWINEGYDVKRVVVTTNAPVETPTPVVMDAMVAGASPLASREQLADVLRTSAHAFAALPSTDTDATWMSHIVNDVIALTGDVAAQFIANVAIDNMRDAALMGLSQDKARAQFDMLASYARLAPTGSVERQHLLALCGVAAWLSGNGALARTCVDEAHATRAGDTPLLETLAILLNRAVPPTAWRDLIAA